MDKFSILVLGVAGGAGHVYSGLCSSSFLILKNDIPFCLVDLGLGVTHTLKKYGYDLPDKIIITHNHTDHSGELPVVLRVEEAKGRKLQIYSAPPVTERLKTHRLAEHAEQCSNDDLAEWVHTCSQYSAVLCQELSIKFYATQHSECCYGFVISQGKKPLIGYTADSGLHPPLYKKVSQCSVSIYDAREQGNQWHASIEEVKPYLLNTGYIIGHGKDSSNASVDNLLFPGQIISL